MQWTNPGFYGRVFCRSVAAVVENDGRPFTDWPDSEQIAVALVLMDRSFLTGRGLDYTDAMFALTTPTPGGRQVDQHEFPAWLHELRLAVDEELADIREALDEPHEDDALAVCDDCGQDAVIESGGRCIDCNVQLEQAHQT